MKIHISGAFSISRAACPTLLLFLASILLTASAQQNFQLDPIFTWGAETNGYRGGISYGGSVITVEIYRDTNTTGIPHVTLSHEGGPPYLMSTDWFAGPMRLIGPQGDEVSTLIPKMQSTNAYPETLDWPTIQYNYMHGGFGPESGNSGAFNFFRSGFSKDRLITFTLKDYFKVDDHGDYKLTVWPKLYVRSQTNEDIYNRIDLPPVSTTFTK